MPQRIKGQEVEIVLLEDSLPKDSVMMVRSLDFTFETELKREGYIGETTDRFDTIYNGVTGRLDGHIDSPETVALITSIVNKARRRTPGVRYNIKAVLNFPSGRRARIVFPDVEFGQLPVNFGGRGDYGQFTLNYGCSEAYALVL